MFFVFVFFALLLLKFFILCQYYGSIYIVSRFVLKTKLLLVRHSSNNCESIFSLFILLLNYLSYHQFSMRNFVACFVFCLLPDDVHKIQTTSVHIVDWVASQQRILKRSSLLFKEFRNINPNWK